MASLVRLLAAPTRRRPSGAAGKLAAAVGLLLIAQGVSASKAPGLELKRVADFNQPIYLTSPRGDQRRLFVAERGGRVMIVRRGRKLKRPFLRLRGLVDLRFPSNQFRDQGGLLSMAFAPDYRSSGLFYLLYTHRDGTVHVDEFSRGRRGRASRSSRRTVLSLPRRGRKDLGGHLEFGPDGLLYISLGCGNDIDSSQDLGELAGKILRIDPRAAGDRPYTVPPTNPFVNSSTARPEILVSGLRNPWRFSFDPKTANLIVSDVGEERFEEVNLLQLQGPAFNLGWPLFEGRDSHDAGFAAGLTFPVLSISHRTGICAIVGGYVMRGRRLPSLRGRYVYGDVCSGRILSARLRFPRAGANRSERLAVSYLDSFGRDGRGRLYALSLLGTVYRISG